MYGFFEPLCTQNWISFFGRTIVAQNASNKQTTVGDFNLGVNAHVTATRMAEAFKLERSQLEKDSQI